MFLITDLPLLVRQVYYLLFVLFCFFLVLNGLELESVLEGRSVDRSEGEQRGSELGG